MTPTGTSPASSRQTSTSSRTPPGRWTRFRPASSSTTSSSASSPAARGARRSRSEARTRSPTTAPYRGSATPPTSHPAHEADPGDSRDRDRLRRARGRRHRRIERRRQLRGSGDLRQRRLHRPWRGRAGRGRERRVRRVGRRERQGGDREPGGRCPSCPRQGGRGDEDHRPRLHGLPARRILPDQAAVADRREVRRLSGDTGPRPGLGAAAPADHGARRRAGGGAVPASDREQRQGGRPRPDQQHPAAAVCRALPADHQRPRRRARRPRARPGRDRASCESGAAPVRPRAGDPRLTKPGAGQAAD